MGRPDCGRFGAVGHVFGERKSRVRSLRNIGCPGRQSHSKQKKPRRVPSPRLLVVFLVLVPGYRYRLLTDDPLVPRNSPNSVELLIFVTTQGSGPRLAVGVSWITRPIGVGPNAME